VAYFEFIWLERVVDKLAERDLSTEAVEEVIRDPVSEDFSKSTGRASRSGMLKMGVM
jgi:hypothetical protein